MFSMLLINREFEQCFSLIRNEINVQGESANKTDNHTVSYEHRTRRILVQIK